MGPTAPSFSRANESIGAGGFAMLDGRSVVAVRGAVAFVSCGAELEGVAAAGAAPAASSSSSLAVISDTLVGRKPSEMPAACNSTSSRSSPTSPPWTDILLETLHEARRSKSAVLEAAASMAAGICGEDRAAAPDGSACATVRRPLAASNRRPKSSRGRGHRAISPVSARSALSSRHGRRARQSW